MKAIRVFTIFLVVSIISQNIFAEVVCQAYCLNAKNAEVNNMMSGTLTPAHIADLQRNHSVHTGISFGSFYSLMDECAKRFTREDRDTALLVVISPQTGKLVGATGKSACYAF